MQIALIGFNKSGKTTVFNALTGADAEVSAFSSKAKTHRAVVQVPDPRLDQLCELFESRKLVHASIDYIDPVGIRRDEIGQGSGLGDEMLNSIGTADALVAVIRDFEDESGVDREPVADFEAIALELVLSDLAKVDNRLQKIEGQITRISGPDKARLQTEAAVMSRLKETLEAGKPIRSLTFSPDEERVTKSFQFLTTKPFLAVINHAEGKGDEAAALIETLEASAPETHFLALCGQTEMEIAQLPAEERADFLADYGIAEPSASRMIRMSYDVLGLISFFTAGPTEAHAWTIRRNTPAVEAAGAIHSDLQRGFIRAQVTRWDDLLAAKTFAEAKKRATLRLEGKDYVVQDGDVIEIMFSV